MFKLGIVARIILGFSTILVAVATLVGYALFGLTGVINDITLVDQSKERAVLQLQAATNFAQAVSRYRAFVAFNDASQMVRSKENLKITKDLLQKNIQIAHAENRSRIDTVLKSVNDYEATVDQVAAGKMMAMTAFPILDPLGKSINLALADLADTNVDALQQASDQAAKGAGRVRIFAGGIGVTVLLVSIFCVIMAMRLRRPFGELVNKAILYSTGDLTKTVEYKASDELGAIADAMNDMVHNMRQIISNVISSAAQMAANSEEFTSSAEQTAKAAGQVANSITEVAQGTDLQLTNVTSTMEIVEQMAAGTQQAAAGSTMMADTSDKTAKTAQEGNQAIDVAISKMADIEKTVNHSAGVVTELGSRSKEIGQIADTIAGIAGQTNLLALNAAIEAARAGEQGRGFAVVAEEVRKLAEQSQDAAKHIADLISSIQGETDKAVAAMREGTSEVKDGAEAVNLAGRAFKDIVNLIGTVTSQIQEISASIQQMALGICCKTQQQSSTKINHFSKKIQVAVDV